MNFLKLKVVLFLSLLGCINAFAQNGMVLETNDGKTYSYVLADQPRLSFNETQMIITTSDASASFTRSEITNFRFEDVPLDIKEVNSGKSQKMTYLNGIITVESANTVALYDMSGKLLMNNTAGKGGNVTIDLKSQPKGTYIVKCGGQSLKVNN